ncbi:DUF5691 domain-containing protein [Pedosphaera parvula]|uniref:Uncharacterized protein n=1 Tax=Pedosphaera parvula (strain Ellin514) TaxID=320771 RepID=B9XDN8_PEDPL|nr:DUF5691 domain-containing protein [Pedosphaera parvula]EEF62184.1 conserved hypothetical protein [Pedosphaera parvula Ellin514]
MNQTVQQLAQVALLGTERQGNLPKAEQPLQAILSRLEKQPAEAQLLGTAGLLFLHQRVGRVPGIEKITAVEPAAEETLPGCSARAAAFLKEMLGGRFGEVLPEWLAASAECGKRVQAEDLPALLDVGTKNAEWREAILKVIGQRGVWLAGQNADWSWVAGAVEDEAIWETGSRAARLTFLQRLRKREAARSRELLQSTWAQESPEDRAAFVGAMQFGLSVADENFLESALDDKRKEVRQAAAGLLARLPESRFAQRMMERLQPLVKIEAADKGKKGKAGKAKIEVTLPSDCDKAMARDGIETRKLSGLGEKAFWLKQIIENVPIGFWSAQYQMTVEELIAMAAAEKEWRGLLMEAWANAAVKSRDAVWAEALLMETGEKKTMLPQTGELLSVLPAEQREKCILKAFESGWSVDLVFESMLAKAGGPWSKEFSKAVALQAKELAKSGDWMARSHLVAVGKWMDPGLAGNLAEGWPVDGKHWNLWSEVVDQFIAMVQFRHDMVVALKET